MKKRVLSIFLAINILASSYTLTSCSNKRNNENNTITSSVMKNEDEQLTNDKIQEINIDSIKTKIDSIPNIYEHEEYLPNEKTIIEYKEKLKTFQECPEKEEDYKKIYNELYKNSYQKYGDDNKVFYPLNSSYSEEEKEMYDNFHYAINTALNNIFKNLKNNYKEDICSISSISIINDKESTHNPEIMCFGGYNSETNTICIDYKSIVEYIKNENKIRKEYGLETIELKEYLEKVIEHELNHVRQYPCIHRRNNNDQSANIGLYDEVPSFLIEASAESGLYNYNDYKVKFDNYDYSYEMSRESESLLLLIATFKEKRNINGYYEAIYDCDIKKLWDFFGLDSDEKLQQFYKIFYTFNTKDFRTKLSNELFEKGESITPEELKDRIGNSHLADIMKIVIKDIIDASERDDLSLDDNILLYTIIKQFIVGEVEVVKKIEFGKDISFFDEIFMKKINEIEKCYKEYIQEKYIISTEELNRTLNDDELSVKMYEFARYLLNQSDNYDTDNNYKKLKEKYPLLSNIFFTNNLRYNYNEVNEYLKKINKSKENVINNNHL